ncbi:MAG TPA: putative Ig domain-containing protein, partial [Candidatus Acidoferrales bacterium]|nr:putative Ig domain-containing protein [Candidatus Acidoferrales bacterium]
MKLTPLKVYAQIQGSSLRGKFGDADRGGRMNRVRRTYVAALFLVCFSAALFAGCGGGGAGTIVIELQPSGAQTVDEGGTINYTAIVGGDTTGKGVNWTTKPAGLTGTNCGGTPATGCGTLSNATPSSVTYTAPTGISAGITATETVVSNANASATQTSTISVVLAPAFSAPCAATVATCPLQGGDNGVPYSQTLTITGGVAPYTWTVIGSLPACLTLNGLATGLTDTIVGTPCGTTLQTSTFTIQVKDNGNSQFSSQTTITQTYSITVRPPTPLNITTTSLPQGFTNVAYTASLNATGGVHPLTWSASGGNAVAPGLTLNPTTGQITGVPTTTGPFSFHVSVKDSSLPNPPAQTAGPSTVSITIVTPPPLSITTSSLPAGTVATGYSTSLQATGGHAPYTWTLTQGQLPSGLALTTANSTGTILGIPVLAGTSTFTVQVTDSEVVPMTKTEAFSIIINAGTAGGNSIFNGTYSFLFQGFDTGGPVTIVGTLTSDGSGHITAGGEDSNRFSATSKTILISNSIAIVPFNSATTPPTGSFYSIGTDGRGTIELEIVNAQGTTQTADYQMVLDSAGDIHFFENNATSTNNDAFGTHGEGVMKLSSASSATFSGKYAFLFSGVDGSNKREAFGGVLNADGSTGFLTPGGSGPNTDLNDAGTFSSQNLSGQFSLEGSGSPRGGVTFVLEPTGQPQTTLTFIFYFVSSSNLYFMEDDTSTSTFPNPPRLSGEMILQQPGSEFDSSVLAGTSVATGTGVNGANASVFGGLLTSTLCDGNTSIALNADENNGGTLATSESFTGTCTVLANGRATFSLAGNGNPAPIPRIANAYLT